MGWRLRWKRKGKLSHLFFESVFDSRRIKLGVAFVLLCTSVILTCII